MLSLYNSLLQIAITTVDSYSKPVLLNMCGFCCYSCISAYTVDACASSHTLPPNGQSWEVHFLKPKTKMAERKTVTPTIAGISCKSFCSRTQLLAKKICWHQHLRMKKFPDIYFLPREFCYESTIFQMSRHHWLYFSWNWYHYCNHAVLDEPDLQSHFLTNWYLLLISSYHK